jgi:ABC-2 type transport system permease protein
VTAILRRELGSYFNGVVGFIVLAAYYFFAGLFFYVYCLYYDSASLSPVFSQMLMIIVFLIPLITMKSFSEEKRRRTDQALLTAPVTLFEIVMGKFLAAFVLYALCTAIFLLYALFIALFTTPDWVILFTTLLGMLLMGAALIAIDLFISALTESQAVAAIFSIGVGLMIYMLDSLASLIDVDFFKNLLYSISFNRAFSNFTNGIIGLSPTLFFLSVTAIFLFLCARVFEKRRWS